MADDRIMNLVGGFLKALGAELEQSGSAPSAVQESPMNFEGVPVFSGDSFRGTLVGRDTTLVFDNDKPQTDISLPQLRSILSNASRNAGIISDKLSELDLNQLEDRKTKTSIRTARRLGATIRDCLHEVEELLNGVDLDVDERGQYDNTKD